MSDISSSGSSISILTPNLFPNEVKTTASTTSTNQDGVKELIKHNTHTTISFSTLESNCNTITTTLSTSPSDTSLRTVTELHPNIILGLGQDDDLTSELNRPHLCTICHASYKTRTHLRRHMFSHMSSRPFPCQHCGKGFNRREHLNKHLEAVHSSTQKHSCPYCNKEISRMDHLKRHIKIMHTNKTNKNDPILKVQMACGQTQQKAEISFMTPQINASGSIGQTIITPIPLETNSSVKDGEEREANRVKLKDRLLMETIDEVAANSSSRSRGDKQPPSMTIIPSNILGSCGVATLSIQNTSNQKVLVHQRLPPGSEMNRMNMCSPNGLVNLANLSFSLGGAHTDQSKGPTDKKVFSCELCSCTFLTEQDLVFHGRTHKAQPHKCPECPRAYTRREKLTEHIRCVHQGQKFDCEYCKKKLSRKDHVLRHIRSVHPEVYASSFTDLDDGYITLDEQGKLISLRNSLPLVSPGAGGKRKKLSLNESLGIHSIGDVGVLLRSVCQICFKVFGTAYHLTRHIESCHSGDVRPFSCTACNKMFKRKDHLTKHVKSHCPSLKEAMSTLNNQRTGLTLQTDQDKSSSSDFIIPDSITSDEAKFQSLVVHDERAVEEDITLLSSSQRAASIHNTATGSNQSHHQHAILQNLQISIAPRNDESATGMLEQHHHGLNQGESSNISGGATLIVDGSQHSKQSDHTHTEFSLAVIDSLMQGNVNVVVVDEDISTFLQQSSSSHLTTTFPCGQCQKEFHARDQLITHLQEHAAASESVLPNGQHISDISFVDF